MIEREKPKTVEGVYKFSVHFAARLAPAVACLSREILDGLVADLPPIYRAVIELRYKQGLAYDEIAEVLALPLGTVKARLHRAHRQLKARLQALGIGADGVDG